MIKEFDGSRKMMEDIIYIDSKSFKDIDSDVDELCERIKKNKQYQLFVKYLQNIPVAYLGILYMSNLYYDGAWIDLIAVVEEHRNKGIGKKLLKFAENKVKENLLQRAQTYNMLENILRVEIPTQTVQVEKNGKTKEIEENRFPGYVLVEMVMTDEAWFVVRNTPNVTGFVGSHGNRSKPTPLLEEEIRNILISMGQTVQEFDLDVKVGDTVRIIDGAFTDYTGKITEIDNNKVKMIISMFGNDTVAEVNLSQIAEL